MKQYKVVKRFSDSVEGELVWLNDRRAKSELSNGNVEEVKVEVKEEKKPIITKEEKVVAKTKTVKRKK